MTTMRRIFCLRALAWSPDGTRLAIGGTGTTVRILDAATLATCLVYRGHTAIVTGVAWSPNGRFVASCSHDHSVQVWSSGDGAQAAQWPLQWPHQVAWSPRGDILAASSYSTTVELWEASSWIHIRPIPGGASSLAWSPDGRWLAAGTVGQVRLLPIAVAGSEHLFACRALKYVLALSWSPNGGRLAAGGNNPQAVEVWMVTPMQPSGATAPLLTYRGHSSHIWSVAWAPSGRWIASGSYGQVHLWDPSSGALRATYHGHTGEVYGLAWSPDGTRIASGGKDRTIQVWDTHDAIPAVNAPHLPPA